MTGRRGVGGGIAGRSVRGLALAGMLTLCGALAGIPARAFEPPPGSKNFATPSSVPNYFSNEAAPFGRRPQVATPGADRFNTAPSAPGYGHAAVSVPQQTYGAAASTGRGRYRTRMTRGGGNRSRFAAARPGRAYAGRTHGRTGLSRSAATASPRKSVAPSYARHSRHAAHAIKYAHRGSR